MSSEEICSKFSLGQIVFLKHGTFCFCPIEIKEIKVEITQTGKGFLYRLDDSWTVEENDILSSREEVLRYQSALIIDRYIKSIQQEKLEGAK